MECDDTVVDDDQGGSTREHWEDQYQLDELLTRRDLTFEVLA